MKIPASLAEACRIHAGGNEWLRQLPDIIPQLAQRWQLTLGHPFTHDVSCAWVAPAARADGVSVVLKIGMPHFEAAQEIDGLRFWDGNPTVRLLDADVKHNAMLLERCEPGNLLRELPEPEQDSIVAQLLRRLWREPSPAHSFRHLADMIAYWSRETLAREADWPDATLVREGLALFAELSQASQSDVLLGTDVHAGNILRAQREPWLVIDPKPFLGDRAYDATQHLFNCRRRLLADADGTIVRFADVLELDRERVRLWLFARAAAEPRTQWDEESLALARRLRP